MEVDLKSYINNNDFFKNLLEKSFSLSNVEIKETSFSNGSSGGDNYCSTIYRVCVTYVVNSFKENKISLIIKCMVNGKGSEFIEELNIFEKERMMYLRVIPKIEKILGNNIMLSPKCLYSTNEPIQTLVFEDLVYMNYKLENRVVGLDENHARFVMMKVAKFHAGSMVFAEENPEILTKLDHGMIKTKSSVPEKKSSYDSFLEQIAIRFDQWDGYESIAKKIRLLKKNIYEVIRETVDVKYDKIKVINHGDMWVNNFMFKYDENGISDLAFIDLQISYYASLGLDINYFLNTSLQIDVIRNKRTELIRHYYDCLKNNLAALNYKSIPTWDDVQSEIRNKEFYGFFSLAIVFPLISMDKDVSKDNNLEMFSNKESLQNKLNINFNTTRYIETMKYSLKRFDELGVLDAVPMNKKI